MRDPTRPKREIKVAAAPGVDTVPVPHPPSAQEDQPVTNEGSASEAVVQPTPLPNVPSGVPNDVGTSKSGVPPGVRKAAKPHAIAAKAKSLKPLKPLKPTKPPKMSKQDLLLTHPHY